MGVKSAFWDNKAILNVAIFRTDIKDYQALVNSGQVSTTRGYLANADKVRTQGVEADFSIRPSERFNFYVNGAYTDAEYKKFAGAPCPPLRGPVFDSSTLMAAAAASGLGVALAPAAMFTQELAAERLVRPFAVEVATGRYWLTRLMSRQDNAAMAAFRLWLRDHATVDPERSLR